MRVATLWYSITASRSLIVIRSDASPQRMLHLLLAIRDEGDRFLGTLEGVHAKMNRARASLRDLETDIAVFCENQRRQFVLEARQEIQAMPSDPPELLIDYSIRAGEIAYNLRSALDHLVWQLVLAKGACPSTNNEFPIYQDEEKYKENEKRKLKGVASTHCGLIEEFQPYHRQGGIGAHLWMLHSICNIDKHRHLNVVNLHSSSTAHLEGDVDPSLTHGQTAGLGLLTVLRGTGQEDKVKIDVATDVCFRDDELENASVGYGSEIEREGLQRPPVALALSSCLTAVNAVVDQLTRGIVWSGGNPVKR